MRVVNRLLAALLALAVIAIAVILTVEVIAEAAGEPAQIVGWHGTYAAGERDAWDSSGVRAILAGAALLGFTLVVSQLAPRRPLRLRLDDEATSVDAALTRRAVGNMLADAALGVDGTSKATTSLKRHRAKVTVTTRFGDQAGAATLRPEIETAIRNRLDTLRLRRAPAVAIAVRPGGKR